MIAGKASDAINQAVCYELQNIVKNYGATYNSRHEGYAVLLEEEEEAKECIIALEKYLNVIWTGVKHNTTFIRYLDGTKEAAINLAKEAVQCAAVCERFIETLKREDAKK